MARLLRATALGIAGFALLAAAGCGSGGGATAPGAGDGSTAPLASTKVIVTADLDQDGVTDVLEVSLDALPDAPDAQARAWRGLGDGGFEALPDAGTWPAVGRIRGDLQGRSDADILDDDGAHCALGAGKTLPYAVLHLERPDDLPPVAEGAPILDAVRPESGAPGCVVGLEGSDLAAPDADTHVRFDDVEARVLFAVPHFVLAVVPLDAPLGEVGVVVTRGTASSDAVRFEVLATPTPHLDEVLPDPVVPGILAVLRGTHLGTPAHRVGVSFAGAEAPHVLAFGRVLFAEVPADAVSGPVTVTVDGVTSNEVRVEVAAGLDPPTLDSVTPARASAGSLVRIEGEDLFVVGQRVRVAFGTAVAALFAREDGALVAIVPADADGDVTVRVGDRTSNALAFERIPRGDPVVTGIDPAEGSPGDVVHLEGTDLVDLGGFRADAPRGALAPDLPVVSFGTYPVYFAFPVVGGLDVVVPFRATAGTYDVTVTLGHASSDPVAFTVR